MHYRINDIVIKTENAAKPINQSNQYVLNWINSLPKSCIVLDYGCGKFRYTIPLARRVKKVYSIDSDYQINRKQIIDGDYCSLKQYAKEKLSNVYVHSIHSSSWKMRRYDYVLCANVLSAIPETEIRLEVLSNIAKLLRKSGQSLICTQFRNSYFKSYENNERSIKYNDGWIIKSKRGYSFYGIIPPNHLVILCNQVGLTVLSKSILDGSVFLIVEHR